MAQTAMTVRMDNQQKAQFDKLCEQFGMSANTAINIFVKAVIRSKSIPFSIQAKNEEDEVTAKAKAAFQYMCDTARENNIDMSLDEINEEIREVRRLRKERNGVSISTGGANPRVRQPPAGDHPHQSGARAAVPDYFAVSDCWRVLLAGRVLRRGAGDHRLRRCHHGAVRLRGDDA